MLATLLLAATPLSGEFLSFEIDFEDSGCIPCTQSLETRLKRIRGVEEVSVDLEVGRIQLKLQAKNRVRLGPLRARISQDGTKIRTVSFVAVGSVSDGKFTPSGLTQGLPLRTRIEDSDAIRLRGRLVEGEEGVVIESSSNR